MKELMSWQGTESTMSDGSQENGDNEKGNGGRRDWASIFMRMSVLVRFLLVLTWFPLLVLSVLFFWVGPLLFFWIGSLLSSLVLAILMTLSGLAIVDVPLIPIPCLTWALLWSLRIRALWVPLIRSWRVLLTLALPLSLTRVSWSVFQFLNSFRF